MLLDLRFKVVAASLVSSRCASAAAGAARARAVARRGEKRLAPTYVLHLVHNKIRTSLSGLLRGEALTRMPQFGIIIRRSE